MTEVRLIVDPPLKGPVNMARDEALLQACVDADAPMVLRFYAWEPATISLGYFQDYAEFEALPSPAGELAVVRRTTGGGAILHDLEVTYSIIAPLAHPLIRGDSVGLYSLAHEAVIEAIGPGVRMLGTDHHACDTSAQRGPFFCFARRHGLDVVREDPQGIGGVSKIAGSAQRRTRTAVLQHGSIMVASRFPQQPTAVWSDLAPGLTTEQARESLLNAFKARLGAPMKPDNWRAQELEAASKIEDRYAGEAWTRHRKR